MVSASWTLTTQAGSTGLTKLMSLEYASNEARVRSILTAPTIAINPVSSITFPPQPRLRSVTARLRQPARLKKASGTVLAADSLSIARYEPRKGLRWRLFESDTSEYSESILTLEHLHSCDATLQICHAQCVNNLNRIASSCAIRSKHLCSAPSQSPYGCHDAASTFAI